MFHSHIWFWGLFHQTNKTKVNHINDNHIKFEVSLHFLGIWLTVRRRKMTRNILFPQPLWISRSNIPLWIYMKWKMSGWTYKKKRVNFPWEVRKYQMTSSSFPIVLMSIWRILHPSDYLTEYVSSECFNNMSHTLIHIIGKSK